MPTAIKGNFRIVIITIFSLIAFAGNSIICRIALGTNMIDASSFTSIRLFSAAMTLLLIGKVLAKPLACESKNWWSALFVSLYAITFSLAYLRLSTGTGAIILFGSVQITMIGYGIWTGERPHFIELAGLFGAFGGLIYFVIPGLKAPSPIDAALMMIAGICWGIYSLRGKSTANDPVTNTSANFICTIPFAFAFGLIGFNNMNLSSEGVLLAVLSGAITSGIGYVIWYTALKHLTATRAAAVQLAVPLLAAFGGIIFLGEEIFLRLLIAASLILGGVALTLLKRQTTAKVLRSV